MRAAADRVSRWLHPRQWGLVALFFALYELAAENSFYLLECSLAAALLGDGDGRFCVKVRATFRYLSAKCAQQKDSDWSGCGERQAGT